MIHSFLDFVKHQTKHEKTIQGYKKDAEDFLNFLEKEGIKVAQTKEIHIKKYQLYLTENAYSTHTIARKMSAMRLYFKYLRKNGMMTYNPMEDIKQPVLQKREKTISKEEVETLQELMKNEKRDYLLFLLVYEEKIKLSDIITIKKKDYNETQNILYLKKKAQSVSEKTKELIKEFLTEEGDFLIQTKRKKPLTEPGAYFIIKTYLKKINRNDLRPIDLTK